MLMGLACMRLLKGLIGQTFLRALITFIFLNGSKKGELWKRFALAET